MTRLLGGLTLVPTFFVALVGLLGIIASIADLLGAPGVYSAPTVGLRDSKLDLAGARGDELTFYFADTSVGDHWAAPRGLRLALGNEETGVRTAREVIAPKEKDWEDPVFWSSQPAFRDPGEFEIRSSLTVPDVRGPETQTLTGRLEGEFLYPGTTNDGMHFTTTDLDLAIPATLKVVSAEEAGRLRSDFRAVRWRRAGLGILFAVVALGYALSYGMWKDREQTRRFEPYLTLALGLAVWACFAALWLKPFGG